MRPDHKEFLDGLKLAAVAIASAGLTATLVIGAGRTILDRSARDSATPTASLILTADR